MKSIKMLLLLLFTGISFGYAQDTTLLLKPEMLDQDSLQVYISEMKGWLFRKGNDTTWANKDIDVTGWQTLMPTELTEEMGDTDGKLEGWFRTKIKLDSSWTDTLFGIRIGTWAASDLYINGNWIASFGNSGLNGLPYKENIFRKNLLVVAAHLKPGNEYTIALHVVDYISHLPPYKLKAKDPGLRDLISITVPEYNKKMVSGVTTNISFVYFIAGIIAVLCLFFWILFFQNRREKNLLLFAMTSTFLIAYMVCIPLLNCGGVVADSISYAGVWLCNQLGFISQFLYFASVPLILARIFKRKFPHILSIIFLLCLIYCMLGINQIIDIGGTIRTFLNYSISILFVVPSFYYVVTSWKSLKGAQWAIVIGLLLTTLLLFLSVLFIFSSIFQVSTAIYTILYISTWMTFPMSLLIYVALRFKEMLNEAQENARQVVQMSEEKREQALNQQKILQEEVKKQTEEIRTTLEDLKSTQTQLVQQEKLASLGALTAGIAHEIKNPLNFVNNFSELSNELIKEFKASKSEEERTEILSDLELNLEKINQHGKRADSIVKNMLAHSRTGSSEKQLTDINVLCEEYFNLAFHGKRATHANFNCEMIKQFDNSLPQVNCVTQDISRVILNLINNAFDAVHEKLEEKGEGEYKPTVTLTTKMQDNKISIAVHDNGNGIPADKKEKIFEPFFTTKPAGQGTGLGLSLSNDIIKAHGGELKVETKEGEGSKFIIVLQIN